MGLLVWLMLIDYDCEMVLVVVYIECIVCDDGGFDECECIVGVLCIIINFD